MNLYALAVGFFTPKAQGGLSKVQAAGEQQGERMAEAYCDGLEAGAVRVLQRRQSVWLGVQEPKRISANQKKR